MHGSVLGFFAYGALQNREVAGRRVLEVGSRDVNGSVRRMIQTRAPAAYLGVDIVEGPGVDRVCDAAGLVAAFGPDSFDVVVTTEMLEHAKDWQAAIANMIGVLRPGGVLVVTTRSPGFGYHHPPDRWRYTQAAFQEILRRFDLEPVVLMDDPEYPGVFVKARKPDGWQAPPQDDPLADVGGVTPVQEPLRLLGLPANPDGCGYYRMWQPWAQLGRVSGHMVAIPPAGQHDIIPDEDQVAEFDLVARQRPGGPRGVKMWRRWKGQTKLVAELDDDIFHPDPSGLPHWLDEEVQSTVRDCVALADLVTCSTETLAGQLRGFNDRVVVLPNYVHEDLLQVRRPRRDLVTLGWAGGATHLQDLVLLQEPIRELRSSHHFDLHLLGTDYSPLFVGPCRFSPWEPNVWDYYRQVDADIGLIPLRDTPFNRARSPIKALEYAALGIPVVASDLDPYREFVIDGVTGFLVRTPAQWQARVGELLEDAAARDEMGAKAKRVARDWTIQQGWTRWAHAYEEVCGR